MAEIAGDLGKPTSDWLDAIVAVGESRAPVYERATRYYEGEHGVPLTRRAKRFLERSGVPYAHNFCERIVDALTDKLIIQGITVSATMPQAPATPPTAATPTNTTGAEPDVVDPNTDVDRADEIGKALTDWLADHLNDIGFDEIQEVVHHDAVSGGDGYAHAYWSDENDRVELAYEEPSTIVPRYVAGRPHIVDYHSKVWHEDVAGEGGVRDEILRLNLYYPDRIEKYAKPRTGHWVRWHDADDGFDEVQTPGSDDPEDVQLVPTWPVAWVDNEGDDRGVAIVHFRNRNRGKRYGRGELQTAMPQQDAINKHVVDIELVSDTMGYPARWGTGITGGTGKLKTHAGSLWTAPKPEARFGQFDAADPAGLLAILDGKVQHLAGTTATPVHALLIVGAVPSGEALKTAEGPFVSKAERRQRSFGNQWERVLLQLMRIALDHAQLPVTADELRGARLTIDIEWARPETRNEREHWEVQQAKQRAGVSKATTLQEDGYNPDEEARKNAEAMTLASAATAAAVNRGDEFGEVGA